MSELRFESVSESRNVVGDWAIRIGVAGAFVIFGLEKFPSGPGSMWVNLFHQIGLGDWFRYFTGVVEVLGGLLVLIPRTALIGFVTLALTMACAALILAFVLRRPADCFFPGILMIVLICAAIWNGSHR
jgi:putative oxidoreductase